MLIYEAHTDLSFGAKSAYLVYGRGDYQSNRRLIPTENSFLGTKWQII